MLTHAIEAALQAPSRNPSLLQNLIFNLAAQANDDRNVSPQFQKENAADQKGMEKHGASAERRVQREVEAGPGTVQHQQT